MNSYRGYSYVLLGALVRFLLATSTKAKLPCPARYFLPTLPSAPSACPSLFPRAMAWSRVPLVMYTHGVLFVPISIHTVPWTVRCILKCQ